MEVIYTDAFERWFRRLRDNKAKASILVRIERLDEGNFGDHRSVGQGVSELRIHTGKGYRVYYAVRQRTVVVLLCGGEKAGQTKDITLAQRMAREV